MNSEFVSFSLSVLVLGVSIALALIPGMPQSVRVVAIVCAALSLLFLGFLLYIKERNARQMKILTNWISLDETQKELKKLAVDRDLIYARKQARQDYDVLRDAGFDYR
jgi:hypothetical protein